MTCHCQVGVIGVGGACIKCERDPASKSLELLTKQALDADRFAEDLVCDGCLAGEFAGDQRWAQISEQGLE